MSLLTDEDDAALVARCRRGEAAAWQALVHRYQRLVYAIVRRAGLDEHVAADVFQTVFTRLLQSLPRIEDPRRLRAWIVTTSKREALLQLERGRRTVSMTAAEEGTDETPEWDVADESPLPEETLSELQELDRLRAALDRLDPRCRDLLRMLFRDDEETVAYEDIARELKLAIGSIGPTRARCLEKLRRLVS